LLRILAGTDFTQTEIEAIDDLSTGEQPSPA